MPVTRIYPIHPPCTRVIVTRWRRSMEGGRCVARAAAWEIRPLGCS